MSEQKTEQPSSKRLRDAREQGDIAKSTELVSASCVLGVFAYFFVNAKDIYQNLLRTLDYCFTTAAALPYDEALSLIGLSVVECALSIVLPIVLVAIILVLITLLAQTSFLFAPKAAIPKLENLSPKKWFTQVFSKKNIFEFSKNLLKVIVLAIAVYMAMINNMNAIFKTLASDINSLWSLTASLFKDLFLFTLIAFSILAIIDFLYVKFKYIKDHMMSIDEVKREFKEMEGDPYIKQKRKQLHIEMINQNTLSNTRRAKVLIVNPTHYAVAIDYDQSKDKLPIVLAKGQGELARRMIEIAKEENIPIVREVTLARALFASSKENEQVSADLLVAVAQILKFVIKLQQ